MKERMTIDHFTPLCIFKERGLSLRQANRPENLQSLSLSEHRQKDRLTPRLLEAVKVLEAGGAINLWAWHNEQIFDRKKHEN